MKLNDKKLWHESQKRHSRFRQSSIQITGVTLPQKISQEWENESASWKGLIFPKLIILPSGVGKKRASFSQLCLSSRKDVSIYSLYWRGMEGHLSIRKQLRGTDTFIAQNMQTREWNSFNSTRYLACQYPPCEKPLVITQPLSSAWI